MADDICDWLAKEEADAEEWGGLGGARYYRKQFAAARTEIERLRAAGDALAEALHGWCNGMDAFTDNWERLRVWQEARRG